MRRRIVITGVGMVTPLGGNVEQSWANVCQGHSGVGPVSRFDASALPVSPPGGNWQQRAPCLPSNGKSVDGRRSVGACQDNALRGGKLWALAVVLPNFWIFAMHEPPSARRRRPFVAAVPGRRWRRTSGSPRRR